MDARMKTPGPAHPITIEAARQRVVVRVGERIIADTTAALTLREANYPPVHYIPAADIDPATLTSSDTHTYCPYKGEADYHGLRLQGLAGPDGDTSADISADIADVAWSYPTPYPAVAEIAGHLAFYPDKVHIETTPA